MKIKVYKDDTIKAKKRFISLYTEIENIPIIDVEFMKSSLHNEIIQKILCIELVCFELLSEHIKVGSVLCKRKRNDFTCVECMNDIIEKRAIYTKQVLLLQNKTTKILETNYTFSSQILIEDIGLICRRFARFCDYILLCIDEYELIDEDNAFCKKHIAMVSSDD